MFFLIMVTAARTVSFRPPLSARDALRVWQAEETRRARMICMDQHHNVLTKEQLRELAAQTSVAGSRQDERKAA